MNIGALALKVWRGDRTTGAVAYGLGVSRAVYERIEAGEVIPDAGLQHVITCLSRGQVAGWELALPADTRGQLTALLDDADHLSAQLVRHGDGRHWLHLATPRGGLAMPEASGRALSTKLSQMFGVIDLAMTAERTATG